MGRRACVHAWVPREVVGRACGVGVVGARTSRSVWVWVDFQVWLDLVLEVGGLGFGAARRGGGRPGVRVGRCVTCVRWGSGWMAVRRRGFAVRVYVRARRGVWEANRVDWIPMPVHGAEADIDADVHRLTLTLRAVDGWKASVRAVGRCADAVSPCAYARAPGCK